MHAPIATKFSSPPPSNRLAFAAIVAANLVFGFGPWLVRLADVGPVAVGFWRLALPLPALAALALRGRGFATLSRRTWTLLAFAGACFAADLAVWHVGILYTRLGNATLFGNISSFLFPLYGFAIARTLPGRNQGTVLALAAVGVALLLGRSYELSVAHLLGDVLCLTAGGFYTIYLIAIERARRAAAARAHGRDRCGNAAAARDRVAAGRTCAPRGLDASAVARGRQPTHRTRFGRLCDRLADPAGGGARSVAPADRGGGDRLGGIR
jgi:threonine/homoserine efflux transporter RhtA